MKRILLLVLLSIGLQHIYGQSSHLKFDHFTVNDGLPERQIQFIKQDDQGYIWVGTQNGLLRYDGYKPKVYRFGVGKDAIYTNSSVISMLIDKEKNLWVSTVGNGLFRYNRSADTFIQYKYPQKSGKKGVFEHFLITADNKGNLWSVNYNFIDGKQEVVKFNPNTGSFEAFNDSQKGAHHLAAKTIYDILKGADGKLWLATSNGLYSYNYEKDVFYSQPINEGTAGRNTIFNIYEAPSEKGVLWLNIFEKATNKYRIVQLDTRSKKVISYNHETDPHLSRQNDSINAIFEDSKHRLWFGTQNGLLLFNRQTKTFTNYLPADTDKTAKKNNINNILGAKNGILWLISGKGLLNFDPEKHSFQRYIANPDDPASLSSNDIANLLVDRSGVLWAGINGRGLDKANLLTGAFLTKTHTDKKSGSYPGDRPIQIVSANNGYALFTNNKGIYQWKPGSDEFKQVYKRRPQDIDLNALTEGNKGEIYFGNGAGLSMYNAISNKLQHYSFNPLDTNTISSNIISCLKRDHLGNMWVGTMDNGICSFDPAQHKFKRYPFIANNASLDGHGKLDDKTALTIYEDRQGTMWIGTNFGGLNRYDRKTGKFRSYLYDGNTRVVCVTEVYEDRKGRFWVGTYLNGLYLFDPKTGHFLKHFDEGNGLLFNTIVGIKEDSKGFLWINTERGLTRLDPRNMSLKNFPLEMILPGKSISPHNFVIANNLMVIGLANGITAFNPDDLADNPQPPIVHIEKIAYSNPRAATDSSTTLQTYGSHGIELPYNQNRLTFTYIAIHFANPSQNKYAYMLEGYDKQWVQAGTQRSVTYTNLSPATYTFRVKAANSDGVWNNEGDSFLVIVNSPLWFRWWAWVIYVVVFAVLIYSFIAYRSRQLKMENLELEGKVNERTKQLSEANKELSEQQEEIITQRDRLSETVTELKTTQQQLIQSEKLASLGELTAGIAHEIQNPLNFVNNFSEVSVELVDELTEGLHAEKRDTGLEDELLADLKQNLEKITLHGKRADGIVKNMLQHSRANSGERQPTDINTLADEYMRLAYHGLRAKDKNFNSATVTNLDSKLPKIEAIPQDIGRVLLNLFNNAFYAVQQKHQTAGPDYKPEVTVSTSTDKDHITIMVKDNGNGIPDAIKDKIMQPFFTTKPTGEGTGLGLSLSYDIVVKGHGGSITVDTKEGEFTEFTITLPLN